MYCYYTVTAKVDVIFVSIDGGMMKWMPKFPDLEEIANTVWIVLESAAPMIQSFPVLSWTAK